MTGHAFALAMASVEVNGPEGKTLEWDAVDWRSCEENVRRLRQRIFKASQAGDLKQVRNLQKLMLRSRANALVSVRQVTERNAGRLTAGVDGDVAVTATDKAELVSRVHRSTGPGRVSPVRRVYIPKANGKKRPLGIPVIFERARQAVVKNALEPEWEARFEPKSYGFRPGRSCQDAMAAIYWTLKGKTCQRRWILDADLAGAFDRIDHDHLLGLLGTFPARGLIRQWLKAGVIEEGRFAPTEEGTPQGGVVSPLLLNVALHGIEQAAGVHYQPIRRDEAPRSVKGAPILIRYADDYVALCHSRQQAEQVQDRLEKWLAPRGLSLNRDKTQIVHLATGFDFLGFNVRQYATWTGAKLFIKPSKTAIRRIRQRLAAEMRSLRGANAKAVIARLNPIIRGWAAYYRGAVSKEIFTRLDRYVWKLTYRWARRTHPNKSRYWIVDRYFDAFNPTRRDRWVFGDRDSGAYLHKFAWTPIVRHQMVTGTASPDDSDLTQYWADRRRRHPPPLGGPTLRLLQAQHGRCPLCEEYLLHADHEPNSPHQWERWLTATRTAMRKQHVTGWRPDQVDDQGSLRLIHAHCHRRSTRNGIRPADFRTTRTPSRPA